MAGIALRFFLVAGALVASLALPAVAADGQIPIPNTTVYATPIVIATPGSYVVTRNLVPTGPGPIIDVAANGEVILELNGHLLDNSLNPGDPVIRVSAGALLDKVTIRNGSLKGGTAGIEAPGPAREIVIEDVRISDFTAGGSSPAGIYMFDVEIAVIRRSVIEDTTSICGAGSPGAGIFLDGGAPKTATITDNVITQTCDGINIVESRSVEVSNNRLYDIGLGFTLSGINFDNGFTCLVSQNTIHGVFGAGARGIRLRNISGCKLYNNLIDSVDRFGINLEATASDTFVLHNVVRASGEDGLRVAGSRNHIERNVLNGNGVSGLGFGLHFLPAAVDNVYNKNSGSGNVGGACPFFVSSDFCDENSFPPGPPNGSLSENMMPPSAGPF